MTLLFLAAVAIFQSTQIVQLEQATDHVAPTAIQTEAGVLPSSLEPWQHVSVAAIKDWGKAKITLRRIAGAFIHSPEYTLEVHGDGTVVFDGKYLVAFVGKHRGTVPRQNVDELVELLRQADLYSLRYGHRPTPIDEGPAANLSVVVNGPGTQSLAFTAIELNRPPTRERLEDAIDRLAGSERWIKGNAQTLSALEAENWDLKSHAAADALARLADFGNTDVALDLIHAGAPLDGNPRGSYPAVEGFCCWALVYAAKHGDLKLIQALLDAGVVTNSEIMDTALFTSAYAGHLDAFHLLLANGTSVKTHDLGGRTLLMAAAASGVPAMLKEILKSDQNVNAITEIPFVPCRPRDLVSLGVAPCLAQPETDGRTALMEAVSMGDYEIPREGLDRAEVVRLLLAQGAEVNARDTKGNTALLLCHRNIQLATLLLQAGADPNVRNDDGETPLSRAGTDEMKRILVEHGAIPAARAAENE
jgi:ankyrin repeat protein